MTDQTTRYLFDAVHSRFTVQAFATGLLSFVAHDPIFSVREFTGKVEFEDDLIAKLHLELVIHAGSLTLTGNVGPADRQEIEARMRAEVLETDRFPQIILRAAAVHAKRIVQGRYRMVLEGTLSLHGITQPHREEGELAMFADGLRLRGATSIRMPDFGIRPITALGGAIRLKDEVKFAFDLAASPESS